MFQKVSGATVVICTLTMVIKYEEQTNKCKAERSYSVSHQQTSESGNKK
jgi:hypothetical protein